MHARHKIDEAGIRKESEKLLQELETSPNSIIKESTSHRQFLEKLLDTFNNRRSAIDSRATFICTIGLALFGFLLTQSKEIFKGLSGPIISLLIILEILPLIVSIIYSLSLIAPLRRPRQKRRIREKTLTWFFHIPLQTLDEYQANVLGLTEYELAEQTAKQVYELSLLLRIRYCRLMNACWYLGMSIIIFCIFLIGNYVRQIYLGGV